jgi:hypothetical protein
MALTPGTCLGPYEVTAQIGAGGMGEVYRATDTNLKRQVAIKVLPEAVASDSERLARFQREAEVLAALNHPNIAGIYGLERTDGQTALVMELVEGPTLADRIAGGAVPLAEALPIAMQIAEALEAAHEQGILPADTPAPIRKLLRRCLEKDRKKRLSDAGDARIEIGDVLSGVGDEVHVRYLDSSVSTQRTRMDAAAVPVAWTTTGRIVFRTTAAPAGLWSVSQTGGQPEPLFALDVREERLSAGVSFDGGVIAYLGEQDGTFGLWVSAPAGSPPTRYAPAPFESDELYNTPTVRFSPDGAQLLLLRNANRGEEAWLMPYPADASNPPRRIFEQTMPPSSGTPTFSWMPDNRRVVMAVRSESEGGLFLADTASGTFSLLSSGTTAQVLPPDYSRRRNWPRPELRGGRVRLLARRSRALLRPEADRGGGSVADGGAGRGPLRAAPGRRSGAHHHDVVGKPDSAERFVSGPEDDACTGRTAPDVQRTGGGQQPVVARRHRTAAVGRRMGMGCDRAYRRSTAVPALVCEPG